MLSHTYTHQKKQYKAICVRLNETNGEEVLSLLKQNEAEPHEYGAVIMIRYGDGRIETIGVGDWVRVGENGVVKTFTDDEFNSKYEVLL